MMRTRLAATLLLAGVLLIVLSFLPVQFEETTILLKSSLTDPSTGTLEGRSVQLRMPADLPSGQAVLVEMTLLPPAAATNAPTGASTLVEGRLDLPGVDVFPAPAVTAPFLPGQPVSFRWLVTAGSDTPLPGRVWLTVISTDLAGNETRLPVLAHLLELDIHRLLGLPLPEARWLGGGLGAVGLVLLAYHWRIHLGLFQKARTKKTAQIG